MKLLIIQTGFLGDAVLASGLLKAVHTLLPKVETGIVVRSEFAELFRNHPAVHTVHPFNKRVNGGSKQLITELKQCGYDTALIPHRSFRSAFIAWRSGIKRRIGFRQADAPWLLTERVEYDIASHELDRNADLLRRLVSDVPVALCSSWLEADEERIQYYREQYRDSSEHLVVLAPGSVWKTKQWSPKRYAVLAQQLQSEGYRILLVGSAGERALCEQIGAEGGVPESDNLAGKLPLTDLPALFSCAARVVTNDSAPLHIAESVGTPVTGVFGPTVSEFGFGTRLPISSVVDCGPMDCRPCGIHGSTQCPVGTHECMNRVSVEMVLDTIVNREHEK